MQCRQRFVCDRTAVIAQKPGPKLDNIGRGKFVKLFGPVVGVDDAHTVFVILERAFGDGLTAIAAFLLTNVEPLLESLLHAANVIGKARMFEALRRVLAVVARLFHGVKGLISVAVRRRIANLVSGAFASCSFSYV